MNSEQHEEIRSLLGAYVLNATSDLEARRVERHLSECEDCTHEVKLLRETTAELSWLPEPEGVGAIVDRISERLPVRPRRLAARIAAGVAAVSIVAAGFLGVELVRERSRHEQIQAVLTEATRRVTLRPEGGFNGSATLHIAAAKAALVVEDLPEPGKERSYQLWAIDAATPRSMTVFEGGERAVVLFAWRGEADRFAVTIEPEGGSPVPTNDPVLAGA